MAVNIKLPSCSSFLDLVPQRVGAASFVVLCGIVVCGRIRSSRVEGQPSGPRSPDAALSAAATERRDADSGPFAPQDLPTEMDVMVIGGCAAGLATGASLAFHGVVNYIVVERNATSGEKWRGRYDRLHLHDIIDNCHLPYFPMPTSFPLYPSRHHFANYLDAYQKAMSVKVLYRTEVTSMDRVGNGGWDVSIETMSGTSDAKSVKRIRVKHVVMAAGVYNKPTLPHLSLPGLSDFQGTIIHSSEYSGAVSLGLKGKKTMVVGYGNSGGEIVVDLCEGAAAAPVHILVRSPICIVPRRTIETLEIMLNKYLHPEYALVPFLVPAVPLIIIAVDLGTIAWSWWSFGSLSKYNLRRTHRGVISTLASTLHPPVMDVGAMDLIRAKKAQCHASEIASFTPGGVVLKDGTVLQLDVIIMATGFEFLSEHTRLITNTDVKEKVGRGKAAIKAKSISNGEECKEAQGLWFVFGNLITIKRFSGRAASTLANRLGTYAGSTAEIAAPYTKSIAVACAAINIISAYLLWGVLKKK